MSTKQPFTITFLGETVVSGTRNQHAETQQSTFLTLSTFARRAFLRTFQSKEDGVRSTIMALSTALNASPIMYRQLSVPDVLRDSFHMF